MNPWDGVAKLIVGFWDSHKASQWYRAWVSVILSGFVTFLVTWGTVGAALYSSVGAIGSLTLGFFAALVAAAGAIVMIVKRVDQFKNIALWFPSSIDAAIAKIETESGSTYDPNKQKDKP